jgi:hypothetical protein
VLDETDQTGHERELEDGQDDEDGRPLLPSNACSAVPLE